MPFDKCPKCGYSENMDVRRVTQAMAEYIDDADGKLSGVYNSDEKFLTVKGKKLRRKDVPKEVAPVVTPAKK